VGTDAGSEASSGACDWENLLRGWPEMAAVAPARSLLAETLDSTQTVARRIATADPAGAADGVLVLALAQTAGRGRRQRPWSSPAGHGVYASLVVRLEDPRRLQRLPLLSGIGLGRALERWLDRPCRLKWPNDLWIDRRKVGGVLVDAVSRGPAAIAVVGFGVNRSQPVDLLPPGATSLGLEADSLPSLPELAAALVKGLRDELAADELEPRGADDFLAGSAHRPGDRISFHGPQGRLSGAFHGIDDDGRLQLEVDGELRRFVSGEVLPTWDLSPGDAGGAR
jgi:BirA family biotin operon repressor/biotin-[acetyl-CoA-carboxylase] ligase